MDLLIILGLVIIGSLFWTAIQFGVWTLALQMGFSSRRGKKLLIVAMVGFPVFIEFVGLLRVMAGSKKLLWDLGVAPVITACTIGLSLLALTVAQRWGTPSERG